jgi:Fic family protein
MLSFELSAQQIQKLKHLQNGFEKLAHFLEELPANKKNYIRRQSIISNIGASTRIENAILTDTEIDWIDTAIETENRGQFLVKKSFIENKLSKDKARSIEEVAGCRNAIHIVFDLHQDFFPLRESGIQGLHRELLRYYPKAHHYLGRYKTQPNNVVQINHKTGQTLSVLRTADPGVITQTAMADLVSWYNQTAKTYPWIVPVACEFVFRFLAIHPFLDGNGRLSRLLFQLALIHSPDSCFQALVPYLGLDRTIEQSRSSYYRALQACSGGKFYPDPRQYNIAFLLNYMMDCLAKSFENVAYFSNKYDAFMGLSESAITLLNCFKDAPESSLKTADLIRLSNLPRSTIIWALKQLKVSGFLQAKGKGAGVRYKIQF